MYYGRSLPKPRRTVTRLVCSKCNAFVDLEGNHKNLRQRCGGMGCDGIMAPYRPNPEAFRRPQAYVANPVITRPNTPKAKLDYIPKPVFYATYAEYLASDLWKHIRAAIRKRDDGKCRICHRPGAEVHHLSYAKEVMEGRDLTKLVLLCRPCHEKVEFTRRGAKRSVDEAAKRFRQLAQANDTGKKNKSGKRQGKKKRRRRFARSLAQR